MIKEFSDSNLEHRVILETLIMEPKAAKHFYKTRVVQSKSLFLVKTVFVHQYCLFGFGQFERNPLCIV